MGTYAAHPFQFVTQIDLVEVTGQKAHDLAELFDLLETASGAIIYYHTHHFLKQHQFLSPEPPNDFAYWVTHILQEDRLGEQLASIDTVRYPTLTALGEKIREVGKKYLSKNRPIRTAPAGEEFHLMKSQSFVLPTSYTANTLAEFLECVKKISVRSIYHHIFQARLRLGKPTNDFSHWLENELEEPALGKAIGRLDPYTQTLEDLRLKIVKLIEERLKKLPQQEVLSEAR